MAVGSQRRSGNDSLLDYRQRALDVLPHCCAFASVSSFGIEEGDVFFEHAGIPGCQEVLTEHDERPEDDVAVRIARADVALALKEGEPLRPIAVGILLPHHPQQDIAYRLNGAERQQHLNWALAHIARAPAATGVLLQAPR